jgi:fluoroquinolone transport system permease protein
VRSGFGPVLRGLLRSDVKNVARAPMLLMSALVPLVILAPLLRFTYPWLVELTAREFPGFDLAAYSGLFVAFLILLTPYLLGWVVGFMLVEERDEGILAAIAVTPLSKEGFLLYRASLPVVVATVAAFAAVMLSQLPRPDPFLLACAIVLAATEAPVMAAFLGATAGNRVEALAMAKFAGLALASPMACLWDSPWHYAAGVLPPFWVGKLLFAPPSHPGLTAAMLIGAAVLHGVYLGLFMWRFRQRLG